MIQSVLTIPFILDVCIVQLGIPGVDTNLLETATQMRAPGTLRCAIHPPSLRTRAQQLPEHETGVLASAYTRSSVGPENLRSQPASIDQDETESRLWSRNEPRLWPRHVAVRTGYLKLVPVIWARSSSGNSTSMRSK